MKPFRPECSDLRLVRKVWMISISHLAVDALHLANCRLYFQHFLPNTNRLSFSETHWDTNKPNAPSIHLDLMNQKWIKKVSFVYGAIPPRFSTKTKAFCKGEVKRFLTRLARPPDPAAHYQICRFFTEESYKILIDSCWYTKMVQALRCHLRVIVTDIELQPF